MSVLDLLRARGVLLDVDVHLARSLGRIAEDDRQNVLLGAALASARTRDGHVCLDLPRAMSTPLYDEEGKGIAEFRWPSLDVLTAELRGSALVGDGRGPTPLVLDAKNRLYLRRYHQLEQRLAESLRARSAVSTDIDVAVLRAGLDRLFGVLPPGEVVSGQRLAAVVAVLRRFAVITGGPGTGKTTTVVKMLALLVEQALARGARPPALVLVAPTGKAAARLTESVAETLAGLDVTPPVRAALEVSATTIHRALGGSRGSRTRFRHDRSSPLIADVLLVDEASMVDLALMTRLVDATPDDARLLLLGDRDQLASVAAGAILGDICDASGSGISLEFAKQLGEAAGRSVAGGVDAGAKPGARDAVVQLSRSYRYAEASGIGALARAIHSGEEASVRDVLRSSANTDVELVALPDEGRLGPRLRADVIAAYGPVFAEHEPARRLGELAKRRVLAAHRRGPLGVESLNRLIERALAEEGLLRPDIEAYDGRPILVTANDHSAALYNGDVGVFGRDERGALRAFFPEARRSSGGSPIRAVSASRLPPHETVFAMTIHKSQGSEFDHVIVVLPAALSPILSRELLYTAVTRARSRVTIYADEAVLARAVTVRIDRASGLRDALFELQGELEQHEIQPFTEFVSHLRHPRDLTKAKSLVEPDAPRLIRRHSGDDGVMTQRARALQEVAKQRGPDPHSVQPFAYVHGALDRHPIAPSRAERRQRAPTQDDSVSLGHGDRVLFVARAQPRLARAGRIRLVLVGTRGRENVRRVNRFDRVGVGQRCQPQMKLGAHDGAL